MTNPVKSHRTIFWRAVEVPGNFEGSEESDICRIEGESRRETDHHM